MAIGKGKRCGNTIMERKIERDSAFAERGAACFIAIITFTSQ